MEKGKRYRVVRDLYDYFKKGEVVIPIIDSSTPFCVLEPNYSADKDFDEYNPATYVLLMEMEVEKIEGEDYLDKDNGIN